MSTIRANTITDTAGTGAPTFSNGIISNGNVGIGTSSTSVLLDVGGNINLAAATTQERNLTIGQGRTGNGYAYVDLVGDATYSDFGLRMIRHNAGPNSLSEINHRGTGNLSIVAQDAAPVMFYTSNTERGQFDASGNFKFNSGYGSAATAYGCRAWVNFNGTGTVAIRASGNVTSITDNGVGDYTVNFTTAMPDASYAVVATSADADTSNIWNNQAATSSSAGYMTASSVRIATTLSGTQGDTPIATVTIFR